MISIGKVTAGNASYYLEQVARTAEEYYSGRGEAQGNWIGGETQKLGLGGEVTVKEFNRALAGANPKNGTELSPNFARRRVLGFDMTFSAPKSVSLMYAIGSDEIREQVREAHDAAVLEGFAYMESQVAWGREGKAGRNKVAGSGLIASAWRHRTSREGDPQLHTHVVANNMIRTEHGRWVSLDSARVYHQAKTGGYVYQAALRRQMTERLGVKWSEVVHGQADVVGIEQETLDAFSKRRQQIEEGLAAVGQSSARAAQVQTLYTRQARGKVDRETMYENWAREASDYGLDAAAIDELCGRQSVVGLTKIKADVVLGELTRSNVLTQARAQFDRRKVIEAVAEIAPSTAGAPAVIKLADRWIKESAVVISEHKNAPVQSVAKIAAAGERSLTTPEMVALEMRAIEDAISRAASGTGEVADVVLTYGLKHYGPTLSDEQRAMVEHVVKSGNGVDVVIGDAGTGKTFAFDVVRRVYEDAGFDVLGASLAAQAARQLEEGAAIGASTIHSLLYRFDNGEIDQVRPGKTVLVIDEAAMVDSRSMARLIAHAKSADIKLVFVGDDKQLAAIDAGGMFRSLADRLGSARLSENRRQRSAKQKEIVAAFRDGRASDALELTKRAGQLAVFDTSEAARNALYESWLADADRANALMIAGLRVEVRDLNALAQKARLQSGEIGDEELRLGVYSYRVGDRVRCRARNDAQTVINGDYGTVRAIDITDRSVTITTDNGVSTTLDSRYASDPECFQLGYAITAHSVQGSTAERAYVLATDQTYRELAYTSMSRARDKTMLFTTAAELEPAEAGFEPNKGYDELEDLTRALSRSEAQALAIDVGAPARFAELSTADLLAEIDKHRNRFESEIAAELDALSEAGATSSAAETDTSSQSEALRAWTETHPEEVAGYRSLHDELEHRIEATIRAQQVQTPKYLTDQLGAFPKNPLAQTYWRRGGAHIERYRLRWGIDSQTKALGNPGRDVVQQRHRRHVRAHLDELSRAIKNAPAHIRGRTL